MFSNRKIALRVNESILAVNSLINRSVRIVEESNLPAEEKKQYRKIAATIMGETSMEILGPIWTEYPQLAPLEIRLAKTDSPSERKIK